MQSLALSKTLFASVRSRDKTHTIRSGIRAVGPGHLQFTAPDGSDSLVVDVTKVEIIRLRDISNWLIVHDLGNPVDVVFGLLAYYPELTPDATVTVIHFELLHDDGDF